MTNALQHRRRNQFWPVAQQLPLIGVARKIIEQMPLREDRRVKARNDIGADRSERLQAADLALRRRLEQLRGPALRPHFRRTELRHVRARGCEALEVSRILLRADAVESGGCPLEHPLPSLPLEPDQMGDCFDRQQPRQLLHRVEFAGGIKHGDAPRDHLLELWPCAVQMIRLQRAHHRRAQPTMLFAVGLQNVVAPRRRVEHLAEADALATLQHVGCPQGVADVVEAGECIDVRSRELHDRAEVSQTTIVVERINETFVIEQIDIALSNFGHHRVLGCVAGPDCGRQPGRDADDCDLMSVPAQQQPHPWAPCVHSIEARAVPLLR